MNIANERTLTFDKEGYIVKKDFPLYEQPHKIKTESPIFADNKFFVIKDKTTDKIAVSVFEVILVEFNKQLIE